MSFNGIIDMRSDTVTRPTEAMYRAMVDAPLGDDVLGDDPTVLELQSYGAALLGKEAALFFPSGTMANQAAMRVHTRLGDEVIVEERSHVFFHEQGGLAQLSGVQVRALKGERGAIPIDQIAAAIRPDNDHYPRTRALVMENTHNGSGGSILPIEWMREASKLARAHGLKVHLDGARLVNAFIKSGTALEDYAACADSVSLCLSKGLGAPCGTLLCGDTAFMVEARRARKVFGGAMRQAGILAAAGLVALRDMRQGLADDHRRAARLAERFRALDGLDVVPPETNMIYVRYAGAAARAASRLLDWSVRVLPVDADTLRFVLHKDVDDQDVEAAGDAMKAFLDEDRKTGGRG